MANKILTLPAGIVFLAVLLPATAAPAGDTAQRSVFISPGVSGSLFVTDKGDWNAEAADEDNEGFGWNVHTGDYNFLLMPSLAAGYMKAPWSLGLRYAYPLHYARLDLPHGRTAKGMIRGTEIGFQAAYAVMETPAGRFFLSASVSARVSGETDLDVFDGGDKMFSATFEPDKLMRNFTVLAGVGYDWKIPGNFSWGLSADFLYSSLDMAASKDASIPLGRQRLDMSVFSVIAGVRGRFDLPLGN